MKDSLRRLKYRHSIFIVIAIIIALLLAPSSWLIDFHEWLHFGISNKLIGIGRRYQKQVGQFIHGLIYKPKIHYPVPEYQYRHYKGHIYNVIGITTPGQCPHLDAINYFTTVHTETKTEQWFDVVMNGRDERMWLMWVPQDQDMMLAGRRSDHNCPELINLPHVVYSRPEDDGKAWARPLASWQSRVPPDWLGGRLLFRLGLVRGRERFSLVEDKNNAQ